MWERQSLESIAEADLVALVSDQVPEGLRVDYKLEGLGTGAGERKEFLADVSSFANAAGGHLVLGIDEVAGLPVRLVGLTIADLDAETLRLDNLIRDGVDPRIPGIHVRAIRLTGGLAAVLIRIPASPQAPHMVIYQGEDRFYTRNSAGKSRAKVSEVCHMALGRHRMVERVRTLRAERVALIKAGSMPVAFQPGAKMVLHLFPTQDPGFESQADPCVLERSALAPIGAGIWAIQPNADGVVAWENVREASASFSYLQVFRGGAIEAVLSLTGSTTHGPTYIPGDQFEADLYEVLPRLMDLQRQLEVALPVAVCLSLLDVQGYRMGVPTSYLVNSSGPFQRDDLLPEPVLVVDSAEDPRVLLRPLVAAVWNAAGWPQSPFP